MDALGNYWGSALPHTPIPLKPHPTDRPDAVARVPLSFGDDHTALVSDVRAANVSANPELLQRHTPHLERLIPHVLGYDPKPVDALPEWILERLRADERFAFALRYMNRCELLAVAAASDVSLGTVKRRLQRAQRRFDSPGRNVPTLVNYMEDGKRWNIR